MTSRIDRLTEAAARFSDPVTRMSQFSEFYHPEALFHGYVRDRALDFAAARDFYAALWSAFPDFHVEIVRAIENGPLVAFHFRWSGIHRGSFADIAATNRQVRTEGMSLLRFQGQQVIERWNVSDLRVLIDQLNSVAP